MAGRKKLSLKQKMFANDFVETKNATEAAFRNYGVKNRKVASLIGCKNLKNPEVVREVERIMEKANITDELLMEKLKEGLDANVVAQYKGEANQTDIPDLDTRFKYLETGLKLKDFFPAQKVDSRSFNLDVQLENMSKQDFAELLKNILKGIKTDLVSAKDQ